MNTTDTTTASELSESYEPATFTPIVLPGRDPQDNSFLPQKRQHNAISDLLRQGLALGRELENCKEKTLLYARRSMAAMVGLGGIIQRMQVLTASARLPFKALFADFKDPDKAQKTRALIGGSFPFTYATGLSYRKAYLSMQSHLEMTMETPERAREMLENHFARIAAGAYADLVAANEAVFSPFLHARSLRQAMLELAPPDTAPTVAETVAEGMDAYEPLDAASLERRRNDQWMRFGTLYRQVNDWVEGYARMVLPQDRAEIADRLEATARSLREMDRQCPMNF